MLQLPPLPTRFRQFSHILLLGLAGGLTACQITSATPVSPSLTPSPALDLPPVTHSSTRQPFIPLDPPPATPSPTASTAPIEGGLAILGLVGRPDSLNPINENIPVLRELAPLLFETLLQVNPTTAQLQPGLAQSWEYTGNGRQLILHLPSNLKWSDGAPLTAGAIVESLKATKHPALQAFSRITARDDETLILTFATIDCAAVTTLAQLPLLPAAEILQPIPRGSGPFQVADWSENKRTLTLTPNPNYRGPGPYLDSLTVRFIQADAVAIALSESQFDLVGPLQSTHHPLDLEAQIFTHMTYPAPQVVYLAINFAPQDEAPLEPGVRQALFLALDREALLAEVLANDGQLMAGSLLPGHWAANHTLAWPDYNPAAAQALLAKAGLKDSEGDGWLDRAGQRLELAIRLNGENALHQQLGWLVSSYYRDLGLFARAEGVPFNNLADDLFGHEFSLAIFNWPLLPDPDQQLYWRSTENREGFGLNFTSYDNPNLDRLLDRAVTVPGCAVQERAEIYSSIQATLATERPVDFLLTPNYHLLVTQRLHGLNPGPFAPFTWNITTWYVREEEIK